MGFQIRNKDGEALTMRILDAEACALWGTNLDPKWYAHPTSPRKEGEREMDYIMRQRTNWFDSIGWKIHTATDDGDNPKWDVIRDMYYADAGRIARGEAEYYTSIMEHLTPYFDLIKHWEDKGYTPHKTKD